MNLSDTQINALKNALSKPISSRINSPVQIGEMIQEANKSMTLSSISQIMGLKDKSFIKRFITILELPEDIKSRIQWKGVPGSISFTTAYIIAIDIPEEKQRVIEYLRTEEGKLISKNDLLKLVIDSRLS